MNMLNFLGNIRSGKIMGLTAKINTSTTGRATCKLCNKKIKKGQTAIIISGYMTEGQIHSDPKDCWHER